MIGTGGYKIRTPFVASTALTSFSRDTDCNRFLKDIKVDDRSVDFCVDVFPCSLDSTGQIPWSDQIWIDWDVGMCWVRG